MSDLENEQQEVAENTTEEVEQPETQQEEAAEQEEAAIIIGGKSFKSQKEALDWAQENISVLEQERIQADAYRQAVQDLRVTPQTQQSVTPTAEEPAFNDEQFYANPGQTLAEIEERAVKKAEASITRKLQAREQDKEIWENFVNAHPDLEDFRDDVENFATQYADTVRTLSQTRGQRAAMDFVAQKTRAKFQAYYEKTKPKTILTKTGGVGSAPAGAPGSVTPQKKHDAPLSLVDQMRKLKQSRTAK